MIRPYRENDWQEVAAIYDQSKPDEMRGLVTRDQIVPLAEDDRMLTYFEESEIWVHEEMGQVLGFIGRKETVVSWLFVHPDHRRRGIGRNLLQYLMNLHQGPLQLNLTRTNQAAMALYHSLGFEIHKEFMGSMYGREIPAARMHLSNEEPPAE